METNAQGGLSDAWSTSAVPATRAFEYWRDLICDTFVQLSASPTHQGSFAGRIDHATYPGFEMSTVRASGQRVRRTPQLIARSGEEYLLASIQTAGRGRVEQGGRVAVLGPGSLAFYDSTRPYTLHFDDDFEQIVIQLPLRDALAMSAVRRPDDATAVVLGRHGASGVVTEFFRSLSLAQRHDPAGATVLAAHAAGLLTAVLSMAAGMDPGPDAAGGLQRQQVLAFVRAHLTDPGLDVVTVARGCHVSKRTLFRLFEGTEDGVAGLVRRLRVERAQRVLREQPTRPVSAVGTACGFAGEAQFHRAFQRAAGTTPAAYRAAARGGTNRRGGTKSQ